MKLESFGISNFKAFGQSIQRLPLKPITLIFGPNSTGKSSLIQGLLWSLHHADKEGDFESRVSETASGSIDLGAFRSLLHNKDEEKRIEIEFSFSNGDGSPLVRVVHQLGITTFTELMRYREMLNSKDPIAVNHRNIEKEFNKSNYVIETLFDFKVPDTAELMQIILDDSLCQKQIEKSLQRNIEMEWDELHGYEDLDGRRPVPDDIVKAYRQAEEARKRLLAIEEEHGNQLQIHWEEVDRTIEQERHRCSILAVEMHQGDNLVLRAVRLPGETELEVQVFDGTLADSLVPAPKLWIDSSCLSENGLKSTECLFLPYKVNFRQGQFGSVFDHAFANVSAWLRHARDHAVELNKRLVYLGPLRHLPERRSLIGVPGEPPTDRNLKLWTHLRDQPILQKQVNQLLERLDCRKYRFQTKLFSTSKEFCEIREYLDGFDYTQDEKVSLSRIDERLKASRSTEVWTELALHDIENDVSVEVRDVGVGISQMVPILIHAGAGKNRFIAVEQPELHLHPALQAELGDVFIESALGENKNTFLLETHSEHLILRLLRRIRETTEEDFKDWPDSLKRACPNGIRPEDVAVLYIEPGNEGSTVKTLRVNHHGEFADEWPNGFFEERIKEVF